MKKHKHYEALADAADGGNYWRYDRENKKQLKPDMALDTYYRAGQGLR